MSVNADVCADGSGDELLKDRDIRERTDPSQPEEIDDPQTVHDPSEDRPLPLTVLTQTKNHRELLDYFLSADIPEDGYNKSTMSKESGVTTNGIRRHIDTFLAFGLVEMTTSEDAHIKRYTVDQQSEVYQELRRVNNVLARHYNPK